MIMLLWFTILFENKNTMLYNCIEEIFYFMGWSPSLNPRANRFWYFEIRWIIGHTEYTIMQHNVMENYLIFTWKDFYYYHREILSGCKICCHVNQCRLNINFCGLPSTKSKHNEVRGKKLERAKLLKKQQQDQTDQ